MKIKITASCIIDSDDYTANSDQSFIDYLNENSGEEAFNKLTYASEGNHATKHFECKAVIDP